MIYIKNGRRYNTDTATKLAEASYSHPRDFYYWNEALYVTPKGGYFIVGEGGASSSWCEYVSQNTRSGGRGMKILDASEASEWLTRNDASDEAWTQSGLEITDA